MQVNAEHLKRLQIDPVAQFLETVNKLTFITNLPPSLHRDARTSIVESFYRATFGQRNPGQLLKNEVLKLQNGSKDYLSSQIKYSQQLQKLTYEGLLQVLEDLLLKENYYDS